MTIFAGHEVAVQTKTRPAARVDVNPWGETERSGSYDGQSRVAVPLMTHFTADQLAGALYWGAPADSFVYTPAEVRYWTQVQLALGGIKEAEELGLRWEELPEVTITHIATETADVQEKRDEWKALVRAYITDVYGVVPSTTEEPQHEWPAEPGTRPAHSWEYMDVFGYGHPKAQSWKDHT
jgi:hypothetical protein